MIVKEVIYANDFSKEANDFVLEGKGRYYIKDERLFLDDSEAQSGLTFWLNKEFKDNILITYKAMVVEPKLAGNLNFFFMARTKDGRFVLEDQHDGKYAQYHERCNLYILTFTANQGNEALSGWSRLRKDPGFNLLSEDRSMKTEINKEYLFEIYKMGQNIEIKINGESVHRYTDNEPYMVGAVGFRTWKTRQCVKDFKVYSVAEQ